MRNNITLSSPRYRTVCFNERDFVFPSFQSRPINIYDYDESMRTLRHSDDSVQIPTPIVDTNYESLCHFGF